MARRRRVLHLAERNGALDQQRALANVTPGQRERLLRAQTGIGETEISVASRAPLAARLRANVEPLSELHRRFAIPPFS